MRRLLATGVLALATLAAAPATARDFGQWENIDPWVRAWYGTLMQPDNPTRSCCAEGDAYWADVVHVETDESGSPKKVIAVITDDRDDGPLGRVHEDIGTRYVVPPHKIKWDKGNPTGHIVIFLGPEVMKMNVRVKPREVLCYVPNGGA
jgi:hypothetical protein